MADVTEPQPPVRFQTHPSRYTHLRLTTEGAVARLALDIQEDKPLRPGYALKQNSYDLGVDIELADAINRLRFEHPEVRAVVITSDQPKIFCAGANIYMLGSSSHGFKVNFCKFTNETRLTLEEAAQESGKHTIAALNGVAAGGGYELALACEEILLQDDGNSAVSFPETPLLAVLPGTGGLTRLVDKRKVRRDLADVFSTLAEGVRGKRAKDWGLVDEVVPRSKFDEVVVARAKAAAEKSPAPSGPGVALPELACERKEEGAVLSSKYQYVTLSVDQEARVATLTMTGPDADQPATAADYQKLGAAVWHFQAFRELDDALLDLRFNHPNIGLVCLHTRGDAEKVKKADETLLALADKSWFAKEVLLLVKRTLKRLDLTAKSLFAIAEKGSCFVGSLLELALASDRTYVYAGDDPARLGLSALNFGALPMSTGNSRLVTRFLGEPARVEELERAWKSGEGTFEGEEAQEAGLATFAPDEIDWEDEVRIAIEERASLSPDALTGMEANLRFCGPETLETKIFARLSAWQNWIFQRPNAVGERGALTMYGRPERPEFDWRRT